MEETPVVFSGLPPREPGSEAEGIAVKDFKRIWSLGQCSWTRIVASTLLMTSTTALTGLALLVIKGLLKDSGDLLGRQSIIIILQVCGLLLAREILSFAADAIGVKHSMRVFENLRRKIFRHLLDLPLPVIQKKPVGEWLARCERDTSVIQGGLLSLPFVVVVAPFSIIFYLVIISVQSMELAVVMLVCALAGVLPAIMLRQKMFKISRKILQKVESLSGRLSETFAQMKTVKSLCEEPKRYSDLVDWSEKHMKLSWRGQLVSIQARQLSAVIMMIAFAVLFLKGRAMVLAGNLEADRLIIALVFAFLLNKEIRKVSGTISGIQSFSASAKRYLDTLDMEEEYMGPDDPVEIQLPVSDITFNDVSFAYDEGKSVLKDLNVSIKRGEIVSIVGLSGAGKTTLFELLLGFNRPQKGNISCAGTALSQYSVRAWRGLIASVFQERSVFRGTIRANLVRNESEVSDEEIWAGLDSLFLSETVRERQKGLDADLYEMGSNWSEGELQRMMILRALFEAPEILLLDEPTSALDARTEQAVLDLIKKDSSNRITLVITHRMNLAAKADRVIVVDQDKIDGIGTPAEMHDKSDLFKYMCLAQHISLQ